MCMREEGRVPKQRTAKGWSDRQQERCKWRAGGTARSGQGEGGQVPGSKGGEAAGGHGSQWDGVLRSRGKP